MTATQNLVSRIHALAKKTNKSPSTLSGELLGSWATLGKLETGEQTITLAKYERAMAKLDQIERA